MFSLIFEGLVAILMVALIVYCVRLDRRLALLRENDAGIRALIGELQAAAERAETSVGRLKSAGIEAEQSLARSIRTAQTVQDDLLRRGRVGAMPAAGAGPAAAPQRPAPSAAPFAAARAGDVPDPDAQIFDSDRGPVASRMANRSDAEKSLLDAIRFARAES